MSIKELTAIIRPPQKPVEVPKNPNWNKIEKKLGVPLPSDYRDFVVTYGTGTLGRFVIVCNAFSTIEGGALIPMVKYDCDILRSLRESEGNEQVPFDIHPHRPGLLPWGGDENGNSFYWLTEGKPDAWPCVVGEGRGKRWQTFEMRMTTFLAKAFNRDIKVSVWPRTFPNLRRDLVFEPYLG